MAMLPRGSETGVHDGVLVRCEGRLKGAGVITVENGSKLVRRERFDGEREGKSVRKAAGGFLRKRLSGAAGDLGVA